MHVRVEKILKIGVAGLMLFIGDDLYICNGGRQFFGGFSQLLCIRNVFDKNGGAAP